MVASTLPVSGVFPASEAGPLPLSKDDEQAAVIATIAKAKA
jgi:hypothetical protein